MRVWRFGDDVNTDQLFPGKYTYTCATAPEILPHLLEDLDPDFAKNVRPGDVILGGKNFGCGSSREHPVIGLVAAGVEAVIAKSFARIFYRSAINQGLLLIECPDAVDAYREGDEVSLDVKAGKITLHGGASIPACPESADRNVGATGERSFDFPTLPDEILAIRDAGGLLEYARAKLEKPR
jgi:3-isopropylmalate/(R)-2-methylmalate dehydratase small subunit